ncbi:MAG: amino acid adenylation domain-containing protein, partial [Cyclobacteriaceae bacterium]
MENSDSSKSALEKWRERKKKESSKTEPVKRIKKLETSEPSTLSHGQERLWLLEQLYPNQSLYTYAHRYSIEGKANIELLKKSLEKVIERHEILRTIYEELNGQIVQVIKDNFELQVDDHALNQSDDAEEVIQSFVSRPFDLATDIPIRLLIIKRTDSVDFIVALHHIAGDAWSINIVNSEMSIIYKALSRNEQPLLPNLTLQYRDFASWQKHKSINQQHLDYWKHKLGGELESLDLPKSKTSLGSFEGKTFSSVLDEGTSLAVADLSTKLKVTPFSLLLTAFHILLGKYSDSFDQIVGTPISNRDFPELEKIIGFFNETYAIRGNLSRNESFKSAACTMSQTILMALAHREITFDILVNEIQPERAVGKNPLFQAMFLYTEAPTKLSLGEEISIHEEVLETRASKFDLTLFVNKKSDLLELTFEYSADIEVSFIERMATHFRTLLKAIITNPKAPISRLPILSLEEFGHMTGEKNRPELDILKRESIQSFIKQRSIQNPSSIAISTATKDVSYAALDQWSNQLASVLVASGLRENEFVGLFTSRSVEMIVGILGILKAGGAYLPLDPDYPKDRIDFMLSDSGCNHILYQQETAQRLDQNQMDAILIDCEALGSVTSNNPLPNKNQIDDFAYLIYTSGSTGKPKGVPITHRQLIHSTVARMEFYHEELTAFLLLSSYSFDSSIAGIFWTLCTGGRLVLPKERIEQDVNQLSSLINRYSISHTLLLPSLYQVILSLVDSQNLQSLKVVIVAGEACPSSMITSHFRLLPDTSLYNEYGPTEATVWCIAHKVEPTDKDHSVPIGKPIINTISYILDEDMNPLPTGMIGELYIGGMGVANGYLNRPELTVEKFLKNPFQPEGYIYKTGDKVRYNKDGNIEFVGRSDEQVKLRGFRIELHEIKEVLISLQAV